jgi:hypothetical protein
MPVDVLGGIGALVTAKKWERAAHRGSVHP